MATLNEISESLEAKNATQQQNEAHDAELDRVLRAVGNLQATIVAAFKFLEASQTKTTYKTQITNWKLPQSIKTPDVEKVSSAVTKAFAGLSRQIDAKKFDLTPVTKLGEELKALLKALPTQFPDPKAPVVNIELEKTAQILKNIDSGLEAVKKSIEKQEITTEQVDVKPVVKGLEAVEKVIKALKFPEPELPYKQGGKSTQVELEDGRVPVLLPDSLVPGTFDNIELTYVPQDEYGEGEVETATYKMGKKIIAKLTIAYNEDNSPIRITRVWWFDLTP